MRRVDIAFLLGLFIYTTFAILIGATVERMRGTDHGSAATTSHLAGGSTPALTSNALPHDVRRLSEEVAEEEDDDSSGGISDDDNDNSENYLPADIDSVNINDDDRAIYLISMGEKAEDISLLQRCLISIRRKGNWRGYVIVLTNVKYQSMYREKLGRIDSYLYGDDSHIIALHPTMDHLIDIANNAKRDSMKIKRFKTRALDVLDQDSRLAKVRMLIYLDIDIVVGRDMDAFLDYARTHYKYGLGGATSGDNDMEVEAAVETEEESRIYLFEDNHMPLHGGITLVERGSSEYCLEKWRAEQDKNPKQAYDQVALLHIWNQNQKGDTKCRVVQMERTGKHLVFPSEGAMKKMMAKDRSYPTFVHVTNNQRAGKIKEDVQNEFFTKLLELTEEERKGISSLLGKMIKGSA